MEQGRLFGEPGEPGGPIERGGEAASRGPRLSLGGGARAVEAELLDAVLGEVGAARVDPALLAVPVRVVVPSTSLREHVSAVLVARNGRALAGVQVQTLHALALEVGARAGVGPLANEALFPVLVRRLAREEPALRVPLDALADGYGSVEASVSDLLDAGFESAHAEAVDDALLASGERGRVLERARAVVRVAARAAAEVVSGSVVGHRSVSFRRAREALEREPARALPHRALFVHGIADATGVQADLLVTLVRECGARVWVLRPPDRLAADVRPPARVDAFTRRLAARLEGAGGPARESTGGPARESEAREEAPEVTVLHAPGTRAECRAVATRTRALLDGGVAPERIGIVARSLASHRLPLAGELRRLAVPFSGVAPAQGIAGPAARRLGALLALQEAGPRAPVERWLEALATLPAGRSARRQLAPWERADLLAGFRALGAARLADVPPPGELASGGDLRLAIRRGLHADGEGEPRGARSRRLPRQRLESALLSAAACRDRIARWPERAAGEQHVRTLVALAREDLGWRDVDPGTAELLAAAGPLAEPVELERDELRLVLARRLADAAAQPFGGRGGGVQVLDALEARARTFEHLFVVGLSRGAFPRAIGDDPLLPDALRSRLREVLPELPVKSEGYDEERYLFALLLSASPHAVLSAAIQDDDGRAQPVSPLLELLVSAGGLTPASVPSLHARPASDSLLPGPELALLAGLHGPRARFRELLPLALRDAGPAANEVARARAAVLEAFDPSDPHRLQLNPYAGTVGEPAAKADPRRAAPSVTALERVAACPWQAFVTRLLRVDRAADPHSALPRAADPRLVGILVHAVLDRIVCEAIPDAPGDLEALRGATAVRVPWPEAPRFEAWLREAARAVATSEGISLPGFDAVLAARARPALEVARAIGAAGDALPTLASEVNGLVAVLAADGRPRELRFRADRVEALPGGGMRLVDYKTGGGVPTQRSEAKRREALGADIAKGRRLQAAAYARAAAASPPAEGRYVFLAPDAPDEARALAVRADDADLVAAFEEAAGVLLEAWERGAFFPRLEEESGREPHRCTGCEVKDACVRGDSGARRRIVGWIAGAREGRASIAPFARAYLDLWRLGTASGARDGRS